MGLAVALAALAAALATMFATLARAQTLPDPFVPRLTDPNNTQRFGRPPDPVARSQPSALPAPTAASAGDTGFDSTGSIRKRKRGEKRKPSVPHLPPPPPPPIS